MTLKEKMLSGQKVYGTMIRLQRNPAVVFYAKNAGLDFLMYDCEHGAFNFETLHDLFITGNAMGFPGLLRVAESTKDWISRALDMGASGMLVPMTETAEQAREIVRWSKYAPIGERGFGTALAHSDYVMGGRHTDVMRINNEKVLSIAQIETRLGVDNAEAIAGTEGIDALLIGPNDLSIALGFPGELMHPVELEAIAHVAAACRKHGKGFGVHAGAAMHEKFSRDETFLMMQSDMDILDAGFRSIRKTLETMG